MDLSFQLYSARNFPPLDSVLAKLSELGYSQVEGFGGLFQDVDALVSSLKANNLTMPTAHIGLDQLMDTDATLSIAEKVGIKTLYCPAIPREKWEQGEDDWKQLAETLGGLSRTYTAKGYGFGWHNHHFEFWPTASGALPMNILLDGAPDIEWEMDVAWVVRGQNDPRAWMDKFGDRITAVHVKDLAPEGENSDEDGWADVGHGVMNWNELINDVTEKTKARYFVAEHDNPADFERFASRSIATAKNWK
ncbi:xylose isomerase [Devosia pacifica]|uniref:Xylose isomerase n=1 Tax=Devosia pacifica TaxID=1335967 RepID=A0A918RT72_9HYPH|nr:sugar phosphate isomerase/epimerase [Devosia pacifica]GHA10301.1 xylose isomerase [Devosia pacifica]